MIFRKDIRGRLVNVTRAMEIRVSEYSGTPVVMAEMKPGELVILLSGTEDECRAHFDELQSSLKALEKNIRDSTIFSQ